MRFGVGVVHGERRLVRFGGFLETPGVVQRVRQVVVRLEVVGRLRRGLSVECERLGQVAFDVVQVAQVDQRSDEAGIGDERLAVESPGLTPRGFIAGIERRRFEKQPLAARNLILRGGGLAGGRGGARAPRCERDDARGR